jgi:Tfp pilus assembly protein PilN
MASPDSSSRTVLGLSLTPNTIEAVLLRASDTGDKVLHRMVRPRLRSGGAPTSDDFSDVLPGMKTSDEVDFTLEVGTEENALDLDDPVLRSLQKDDASGGAAALFPAQLREILAECQRKTGGLPDLAFCVDTPDVAYVELTVSAAAMDKQTLWEQATALASRTSNEQRVLLDALRAVYDAPFDADRVAFVPMASDGPDRRVLALVPTSQESVSPTLRALAATDETADTAGRLLDTEASLLTHLAATHVAPGPDDTTAVVRVGSEDTLLLFLTGSELRRVERLRSLTSFDPAETICSRVLLHQDEYRINAIDHVLLAGGPRDSRLAERFEAFYEDATVHVLHAHLAEAGVSLGADVSLTPDAALALAVAQRMVHAPAVNLFGPVAHTRRRAPAAFAWHTVAVLALLFAVALFFGWRYMEREQEIAQVQQRHALAPVEMPELSPEALKLRVDSLNAVHRTYTRALDVLDSLLVGSDEWSRALERTSRLTGEIDGLWFDNWSIDASTIKLQGHALKRSNLAALTRALDGTVQELKFTDIQGARAYPFVITIPRHIELPEVTTRLRDEALPSPPIRAVSTP